MDGRTSLGVVTVNGAGNITALQRNGANGALIDNLSYSYVPGTNRLSTVTDAIAGSAASWDAETGSFTYDANGNMLTAPAPYGVTAAFYDHRNLPLLLTANGVMSAYRYDEQGQRISKRVTGSNLDEFYILDGRTSLGVVTVDGAGNAVSWTWNVLAGDKVVGRETQTAQRFYYHTDLLGTTRVVVQGTTVVEAYDYDPWGVRLDGRILAGPTKEGFTTKERDAETGLDYFGARYYMAALGRWTSVDPIADDFVPWSPYNYTLNSPSGTVDPDGRDPVTLTVIAISFGIGAFIGAVVQERRNIEEGRPAGEGVFRAALIGGTIAATGEFLFTLAAGDASAGVLTAGAGAVAADVEAAAVPAFARSVGGRAVAAADGAAVRSASPGFVVTSDGVAIPVPNGAMGPAPTRASGFQFTGGSGGNGLDSRVTGVRIMDANAKQGQRAVFMNKSGQTVNPSTGRTVNPDDPAAHFPFKTRQ